MLAWRFVVSDLSPGPDPQSRLAKVRKRRPRSKEAPVRSAERFESIEEFFDERLHKRVMVARIPSVPPAPLPFPNAEGNPMRSWRLAARLYSV